MTWGRARRQALRAIRAESARIVALVLGFALVVGFVRGGSHYLYCPFMDAVVDEHCCAGAREDVSTVQAPDCCEARTIGTLPSVAGSQPVPAIVAPNVVAVLPVANDIGASVAAPRAVPWATSLTGPPRLAGAQRAARLMVFLI